MRVLLRPSDHHNHAKFIINWTVTHRMVVSRSTFPSESAIVYEALSLGSCRFECFMFAGHEAVSYGDVRCAGVAMCAKRARKPPRLALAQFRRGGMGPPCRPPGSAPAEFAPFHLSD